MGRIKMKKKTTCLRSSTTPSTNTSNTKAKSHLNCKNKPSRSSTCNRWTPLRSKTWWTTYKGRSSCRSYYKTVKYLLRGRTSSSTIRTPNRPYRRETIRASTTTSTMRSRSPCLTINSSNSRTMTKKNKHTALKSTKTCLFSRRKCGTTLRTWSTKLRLKTSCKIWC
jgi:hypothetical protein